MLKVIIQAEINFYINHKFHFLDWPYNDSDYNFKAGGSKKLNGLWKQKHFERRKAEQKDFEVLLAALDHMLFLEAIHGNKFLADKGIKNEREACIDVLILLHINSFLLQ